MTVPEKITTYPVRVLVREVGYVGIEEDITGQPQMVAKRGFGPRQPQLDPSNLDLEPGSTELADAVDEFERGQIIYLLADDYKRHMKFGVVRDVATEPDAEEEAETFLDPETATADDLANWIRQEKPTVNDVVQASQGDVALATKLLEAESLAHDGEPRVGVMNGLSAVIQRAEGELSS